MLIRVCRKCYISRYKYITSQIFMYDNVCGRIFPSPHSPLNPGGEVDAFPTSDGVNCSLEGPRDLMLGPKVKRDSATRADTHAKHEHLRYAIAMKLPARILRLSVLLLFLRTLRRARVV